MSKTRSHLLRRLQLATAQVLEDLRPRAGVSFAEAVTVDDNSVCVEGDLDRVLTMLKFLSIPSAG